jgi:hypothetical protein
LAMQSDTVTGSMVRKNVVIYKSHYLLLSCHMCGPRSSWLRRLYIHIS